MNAKNLLVVASAFLSLSACAQQKSPELPISQHPHFEVQKTDDEWRAELSPMQYKVLREAGTERPFVNKYNDFHGKGTFVCAACGNPLFDSDTKFKSGTGWPSFYTAIGDTNVVDLPDNSAGMRRVEVLCGRCGGHLGHVFTDGPPPTGLRYCVNSAALEFEPAEGAK